MLTVECLIGILIGICATLVVEFATLFTIAFRTWKERKKNDRE